MTSRGPILKKAFSGGFVSFHPGNSVSHKRFRDSTIAEIHVPVIGPQVHTLCLSSLKNSEMPCPIN